MDIKAFYAFSDPSFVSFKPAARVLLSGQPHPLDALTVEHWRRALSAFQPLLTTEASNSCDLLTSSHTFAELFIDAVLVLQKIFRHPAQQRFEPRPLDAGTVEVSFTLAKKNGVEEILRCALALVNYVITQDIAQEKAFADNFQKARQKSDFRLVNLFLYDRLNTASLLGVPIQHDSGSRSFLGQGQYGQLLAAGYTTMTSRLGKDLAGDKSRTARLLNAHGLPSPKQYSAYNERQAVSVAQTLGYPVVLKPKSGNKGRGVSVNLSSDDEVRAAFQQSVAEVSDEVVVETFVRGDDYRLLVVGARMIAAVKRIPAMITGDGVNNIENLMKLSNKNLQRDGLYLFPLKVDPEVSRLLAGQNLQLNSIPVAGKIVYLRAAANQSLGGTTLDVTDLVHPDNCAMAVAAARVTMLDVAGVDFVTEDISRSWREGVGGIVEINAGPGVDLHMCPTEGRSREVSWHMIRQQFPADSLGRIPVVMVTGKYHKTSLAHSIERLLALAGYNVGLSAKDGVFVSGRMIATAQPNIKQLLKNPVIDAAVIEVSMSTLAIEGAPVDMTSVTLITEGDCSLSLLQEIHDEHAAPRIRKLAAHLATHNVIVDASLSIAEEVLAYMPANKVGLIYTDTDAGHLVLKNHLLAGGWVVRIEEIDNTAVIVFESQTKKETIVAMEHLLSTDSKLREVVFGIATMVGLGYSLNDTAVAIKNAIFSNNIPSTLQACTIAGDNLLTALDPRDKDALDNLVLILSVQPKTARTLIIFDSDNNGSDLAKLITRIHNDQTWFFCEKKLAITIAKYGIPEYKINSFSCMESATQAVDSQRHINDSIVFFIIDDTQRHLLFKRFITQHKAHQQIDANSLWHAKRLAFTFKGSWLGGSDACIINGIAFRSENASPGDLVIIPYKYTQTDIDIIEAEVKSAIAKGAAGVVAPLAPVDIPRYYPILISDDPCLGLQQLASVARSEIQGRVICFMGEKNNFISQIIENKQKSVLNKADLFYDQDAIDVHDNQVQMMLSLVRVPRSSRWSFFYIPTMAGFVALLRPDLCIVNAEEFDSDQWAILAMMLPSSEIVILCDPNHINKFTAQIKRSSISNIKLLAVDYGLIDDAEEFIFS